MDRLDRELISLLQQDGRMSFEELGRRLNLTGMGAKKRLKKLLDEGMLRVTAVVDAERIGVKLFLIMADVGSSSKRAEILNLLEECPRIVQAFSLLGAYNLCFLLAVEDDWTLENILSYNCVLGRCQEDIRKMEVYSVLRASIPRHVMLRMYLSRRGLEKTPCGVLCISCEGYEKRSCVGCPATKFYRGTLP
ncbi:MAG: hypothetical protein DRJ97_00415 [Thermoprotei archaeon]|nr:MAG: hypothetical protein DRJ97_00415 [Thermoprotei archaeon]